MGRRRQLWLRLRAEVMGPTKGPNELLGPGEDPRDLYVTGVLAPMDLPEGEADPEATTPLGLDDAEREGDEAPSDEVLTAPTAAAFLDPKAQPRSFGISFSVPPEELADVAVTWGDYRPTPDGRWQRYACAWIVKNVPLSEPSDPPFERDGLRLHVVPDPSMPGRVSLYVQNARSSQSRDASSYVFQPQLRVLTASELLNSIRVGIQSESSAAASKLLYRNAEPLARGHMTAAVWRAIDPERYLRPEEAAAWWPDIAADPELGSFLCPTVRSEFLPAVDLPTPGSVQLADPELELRAAALAELGGQELRTHLDPLVRRYRGWIESQREDADGLGLDDKSQAEAIDNIRRCERLCQRIDEGIRRISDDEEARLAFSFAMKAISVQAEWQGHGEFKWRPFQLAFILLCLSSVADPEDADRSTCDLLWFATGGGKTEAYLALVAFALGLARLRATADPGGMRGGFGTVVITRYTLRLLTLQQFRRTARLITACEFLRVAEQAAGRLHGWRPRWANTRQDWLWGTARFSVGLWVGGSVTPNRLKDGGDHRHLIRGALSILSQGRGNGESGEPAQVVTCPACGAWLVVPPEGLPAGAVIHLVYSRTRAFGPADVQADATISYRGDTSLGHGSWRVLSVEFTESKTDAEIVSWWTTLNAGEGADLGPASPARPGYFLRSVTIRNSPRPVDFDVYCPAPRCPLNGHKHWEQVPVPLDADRAPTNGVLHWQVAPPPFRDTNDSRCSWRTPIPALTVDEQLYRRLPSVLVATVDKFARLAFEPRAAGLFGTVNHYNARTGFYRMGVEDPDRSTLSCEVGQLPPPVLVLQDELHLIEGPLGSLAGLYETAISELMGNKQKYLASTATIAAASEQIAALYDRKTSVFPQPALSDGATFWSEQVPDDPFNDARPGRLYVGMCAPGKGAQTPLVRLMSTLLQEGRLAAEENAALVDLDPIATVVGYFNAVRELAGAVALSRQDVLQWMQDRYVRPRAFDDAVNLSSQAESTQLPVLLDQLAQRGEEAIPLVVATSMFGTGVDVPRLGVMFVNGQPKTTATYIQATGRIGRETGGLVVTLLRASRPRDLDHYEFFTGYHIALSRGVEPVTVAPFSPRARERLMGPLLVAMLRQARSIRGEDVLGWATDAGAGASRRWDPEASAVVAVVEDRARSQPADRCPGCDTVRAEAEAALDRWASIARDAVRDRMRFQYVEYAMSAPPTAAVVLGDASHDAHHLPQVYERVPQSMREVEAQTRFGLRP